MAIIKCKHCGENISDRARECPYCGKMLIDEMQETNSDRICTECCMEIPEGEKVCPHCGFPYDEEMMKEKAAQKTKNRENIFFSAPKGKMKKYLRFSLIAVIIICVFIIASNTLTGDDKVAYDLIMTVADDFKNPSSVRLVSGTLSSSKDYLFCGISAENGFGARSMSYYSIGDGIIFREDSVYDIFKKKDGLNFEKINRALSNALKNK